MHANLDERRVHLMQVLSAQLERRDGCCGYLGLHQRLDWGTSGVVVLARQRSANASLAQQFASHSLSKIYLALVYGTSYPECPWRVEVPLGEPKKRGGRVSLGGMEAKEAATRFRVLARRGASALLEAQLESGRKHQIRAHLLSCGLQLYGDELYGAPDAEATWRAPRPMLHAAKLILQHPLSGETLALSAPPPEDFRALARDLLGVKLS